MTETTPPLIRIGQPAGSRADHRLCDHPRRQPLPHDQRHHAVAADGDLSDAEGRNYGLDFVQIGLLTLAFQVTASLLQPLIGMYTDKRPLPYSLPVGMASTLVGLRGARLCAELCAAAASAPALVGFGSAIFHPEIVARGAAGVGRPLRPGAIGVPGRRQFRLGDRAAARRLHRRAARADQRRRGSRWRRWSASSCCGGSAAGTARICATRATRKPLRLAVSGNAAAHAY